MSKAIKSNAAKAKQFFAEKMTFTTGPVEVSHLIEKKADVAIIDVREANDFKKGHVPGAVILPQEKWSTCAGLRRDAMNISYCYAQNCHMGAARCDAVRREGLFRHGNGWRLRVLEREALEGCEMEPSAGVLGRPLSNGNRSVVATLTITKPLTPISRWHRVR